MASAGDGGGLGGKPLASVGAGSSRQPVGGSGQGFGLEDSEEKQELVATPRRDGSVAVGTRKELGKWLHQKEEFLLEAQTDVAFWSKELRRPNLTAEEKRDIRADKKSAEKREVNLKTEIQELKGQLQQLSARHMDPSGVRSESTPSKQERGKLGILVDALATACGRAGWTVCIGRNPIIDFTPGAIETLLKEEPEQTAEDAWALLKIGMDVALLSASDVVVDFQLRRLASESEDAVQMVLESVTNQMHTIKNSYGQCNGPFFKYPNKSSPGTPCYTLTGKPDAASLLLPLFLEIKSDSKGTHGLVNLDYDALLQAFERVETTMANGGYLSRCVALVVTGHCKWIISALRNSPENPREMTVSLLRLNMEQEKVEERIWMSMSKAALDEPKLHLTQDGPFLVQALRAAGISPAFCRVRFLTRGMSNVYECTVPIKDRIQQTTVVLETASKEHRFCVKVVHSAQEFEMESRALHRIASHMDTALVPHFYFLGSWRAEANSVSWRGQALPSCIQGMADLGAFAAANWWQLQGKVTPVQPASSAPTETKATDVVAAGGVIFMRWGKQVDAGVLRDKQQQQRVWDELRGWLHLYHAAGVLHTDLRWSNVADFGDHGIQPIDFGMSALLASKSASPMEAAGESEWEAMSAESAEVTLVPGGRTKGAGQRIRTLVEAAVAEQGKDFSVPAEWSRADDWDMLLEMALHAPGYS